MSNVPGVAYAERRNYLRLSPERAEEAFVEFELADGSRWMMSLVEIGAGGFGFQLHNGRPALAIGTRIDAVTIHVDGYRIAGSARVAHVSTEFAAETLCGAEFAPSTEVDARKMTFLLNELEQRTRRSG